MCISNCFTGIFCAGGGLFSGQNQNPIKKPTVYSSSLREQIEPHLIISRVKHKLFMLSTHDHQVMEPGAFLKQHKLFRVDQFEAATGLSGSARKASLTITASAATYCRFVAACTGSCRRAADRKTARSIPFLSPDTSAPMRYSPITARWSFTAGPTAASTKIQFLTGLKIRPFDFRGVHYRPVSVPPALIRAGQENLGVQSTDRAGEALKVATLERSLVDALDRPELCGGWEEVWRSLEMIEYLDLALICRYVAALGNATTAAKTGWFLEENRERLMVDDSTLDTLRAQRPASPHYVDRGSREPEPFSGPMEPCRARIADRAKLGRARMTLSAESLTRLAGETGPAMNLVCPDESSPVTDKW